MWVSGYHWTSDYLCNTHCDRKTEGNSKKEVFRTFDYSIRVINNHAESTLTRAYREYVFTYKRGSVVSGTRDHITGGLTDSDQTKKEKKELYVQSLESYFESSKLLALWSLYSKSCKLLLVISLFQRC